MITTFHGKRISGILAVLPENEYDYDVETAPFTSLQTRRLKRIMGFSTRRAAKLSTSTGDLCHYALKYALDNGLVKVEEIGAIIVLGLTPDYFVPHNSNILHGEFGFTTDVVCMDIPQGCCGFTLGMMQACMLLDHIPGKKALVLTADVLNRKNPEDPLSAPSFGGDACGLTVVESDPSSSDIFFNIYNNGADREALIMHAGAWRMPRSPATAIPRDMGHGDGAMAPYDALWMNGSMVFNFVQKEVPPLIHEIVDYAGIELSAIDKFYFHQPNKFMVQKLAERTGIPFEKIPMNIVGKFGNSSGSSIPVNITYNTGVKLETSMEKVCMSGFGSGLTWSSIIMDLGNLDFCKLVISDL